MCFFERARVNMRVQVRQKSAYTYMHTKTHKYAYTGMEAHKSCKEGYFGYLNELPEADKPMPAFLKFAIGDYGVSPGSYICVCVCVYVYYVVINKA